MNIFKPDLIIFTFLIRHFSADIYKKYPCIIVHPGIKGDRSASSLNWTIQNIFAALAEFERDLISERTRGRTGSSSFKMTPAKVRLAAESMQHPKTKVSDLCKELGITWQMLYRYVSPDGSLRESGNKLLKNP